ncbi:protein kinase [Desulfobacterales bacterium HSG2]|nr:protein kinase [Desulfobacterales bacterium HSG2]
MAQKKQNCWEYMECGRQPGGDRTEELGVCPAAADPSFDGSNCGKNAGRMCWAVAGTFCEGKVQGSFTDKRDTCMDCDFFKQLQKEEGNADSDTKFLKFISENAKISFLNQLTYKCVKAGERFITQGESGDEAYIIHSGTCLSIVEKDGKLHPVSHRGKGDIVGMTSVLTGEPRYAHAEAETDMKLWVMNKAQFDNISREDPDLTAFLTELVANQFDSKRPAPERIIGKYVANDVIGRGGYSIVYKGVHTGLNIPVAIKMMRHDLVMNADFLNSFRNEAKIIAGLSHENIIRVYDIEERFRTVFIIMEHLEGESLRDMLKRLKTIPPMLAADFLIQICSGLDYAHEQKIIHRDINTINIFVQRNDRLKILDFGLACPPGTDDFFFGGAFDYLAPELFDGEPANQQSDIYALGITAYEMVTGKMPYPEGNAGTLMKMRRTQDVPDPAETVPDLPELLRRFILKACRINPDERYRNVRQALEELGPLARKTDSVCISPPRAKRKMTTLFLIYEDEYQQPLRRLLEEFSVKVKELGVDMKTADFRDI